MTDEAPEGASTDPLVDTGRDTASRGTLAVGVDVGGSGIKAAVVDTTTGTISVSVPTAFFKLALTSLPETGRRLT